MKRKQWLALCTLLAALAGAQAAQSSPRPDPADPGVAVPPPAYVSAMKDYLPAMKDGGPTPDRSWRAANAAVAGQNPHAGHQAPGSAPASAPAQPAPQRTESAPASSEHHQHQHQHH